MNSYRPGRMQGFTRTVLRTTAAVLCVLALCNAAIAQIETPSKAESGSAHSQFEVKFDKGAVVSLRRRGDRVDTDYVNSARRLGDVIVRYRQGDGEWRPADTAALAEANQGEFSLNDDGTRYQAVYRIPGGKPAALALDISFAVGQRDLSWTIKLQNLSDRPLEIGDLAVPLPISSPFGRRGPTRPVILKHSFISGHGSFIFWMRSNSVGPYLTLTPADNTSLEYWDTGEQHPPGQSTSAATATENQQARNRRQRVFHAYIHSAAAGEVARAQGTNWRQPHTWATLNPQGQTGDSLVYRFRFDWADDNKAVRQILVDNGLIDVHVVPGMTVPNNITAQIALHTTQKIAEVEAEHPEATTIEPIGKCGEYELYKVRFNRLGENRLKIRFGNNRHTFLEFFSTEPLETLINKRAAFIARCQHRDPTKWYDGLISEWNMDSQVLLSPDNCDRISGFRIYAVTCDDPGLSKPAYLAAKSAEFPVQSEVAALDYYIKRFVWGGLQRTTDETYPYAVYGIQDWKRNRESDDPGRNGRLHIWRCYDYPHIILMYFNMYRVAKSHPQIETALEASEYLERAYGTAMAMFTVPYEIERWSAYRTGFYNELVIVDLIDELESMGKSVEAGRLRDHWERKVEYFVNDRPDLFASEYPFDSTGFESTHALAKYALQNAEQRDDVGGENGGISRQEAHRFMETQLAANIFCRGWLEPAYYYLGSDYRGGAGNAYTLTYMSQMGGWSVLDYALHFATEPHEYLRLGYASYLSSWALMNTGTPESNYGYWYPGLANDGGAGGGFEPAPYGRTWLDQPHHRGSWYYACEIDLGFCGALRAASTILADDPIFGRYCYGGDWQATSDGFSVTPKDGLRRRFHVKLDGGELHLVLDNTRFAAVEPILLRNDLSQVHFALESDNPASHQVAMRLSGLAAGRYVVHVGTGPDVAFEMPEKSVKHRRETVVEVTMPAGGRTHPVTIARAVEPRANTFSIVAYDPQTGDLGIAVASKVLGVGSIVPYAKANVGAIATQSAANTAYGPDGLALLASGKSAKETVRLLTEADDGRDNRQLGIVDAKGNVAVYSGSKCNAWFGHIEGDHYTVQGNLLAGEEVLQKMAAAFEEARKTDVRELADWLVAALHAGDSAGGDKRGKQSAAIMVVREKAGYGQNDRYIDLRVEDHAEPVAELSRLLDVHKENFAWPHRHPPRRDVTSSHDDHDTK